MAEGAQDPQTPGTGTRMLDAPAPERTTNEPVGATVDPEEGEEPQGPTLVRWPPWSVRFARSFAQSFALPLALVSLIGVVAMVNHFSGHDWGDDFALYMRQAKALVIGNVGEVVSDNRFSVDNSGWSTFSPTAYPWGWPLLIAPFYAVFGINYEVLKIVEVLAFCLFLLSLFSIVGRRAGRLAATALILVIGLSPIYISGTDTVLSDMPFLAFLGVSLWWMDRCRLRGLVTGVSRRQLVVMGLLIAYSFNVRREGIILLFAFAALHLTTLIGPAIRSRSVEVLRSLDWRKASVPYVTFALAVVTFHLLLPTVLVQRLPGTGFENVSTRLAYYQDILAQQIGLEDPGLPMELFGSELLARRVLLVVVALAGIGLVFRLRRRWEEDIGLATFLGCSALLMLIYPAQEPRYLNTVTPFLLYFAYQALPTMARATAPATPRAGRFAVAASAVALVGFVGLNAQSTLHNTRYHLGYSFVVNGPETPAAQEMFAAVKETTRASDVILFFRSRAMTLYTDRRAIMGVNLEQLLPRSDWYVMEKGGTYSQRLLSDGEAAAYGLTKEWENEGWVIWRVPPLVTGPRS